MRGTRILLGVLVALVVLACGRVVGGDREEGGDTPVGRAEDVIGGVASPGPTIDATEPRELRMGEAAPVSAAGVEVGRLAVRTAREQTEPDTTLGEAPEFGRFVVVEIHAEATGGTFIVGPLDFWLRDPDGQRYLYGDGNALFSVAGADFAHAELSAGEEVTGEIAFDAPDGPLELVYAPGIDSRALLSWTLD